MEYSYCLDCESLAPSAWRYRGSCCLEIFLWLFFLIPGLFYTIWRRGKGMEPICSKCKSANVISPDSPRGVKLLGENWRDKVP